MSLHSSLHVTPTLVVLSKPECYCINVAMSDVTPSFNDVCKSGSHSQLCRCYSGGVSLPVMSLLLWWGVTPSYVVVTLVGCLSQLCRCYSGGVSLPVMSLLLWWGVTPSYVVVTLVGCHSQLCRCYSVGVSLRAMRDKVTYYLLSSS